MSKTTAYTELQVEGVPRKKQAFKDFFHAWRLTVSVGALVTFLVLWVNVGLLLWAQGRGVNEDSDSVITLYQGSCSKRDSIIRWSHIGINALSTILLGASSACMQVLSAPTKEEIDRCHARGTWLDIGIASIRNLRWISKGKVALWALLGLTSVPLHLFYNSVIFTTQSAIDYPAILVTKEFVANGSWAALATVMPHCAPLKEQDNGYPEFLELCPVSNYVGQPPSVNQLFDLQQNVSALRRLENEDCLKTFATNFEPDYRSVLLVSDASNTTDSVMQFTGSNSPSYNWRHASNASRPNLDSYSWMCADWEAKIDDDASWSCNIKNLTSHASNWQLYNQSTESASLISVDYCLVEPATQAPCTVELSRVLLLIVIVFNVIKIFCFLVAFRLVSRPLITMGDAIESFLQCPDPTTSGFGPLSALDVRKRGAWRYKGSSSLGLSAEYEEIPRPSEVEPGSWLPKHSRWFWAASPRRWAAVMFLCVTLWIVAFALLTANDIGNSLTSLWKAGFGQINKNWYLGISSQSLTSNALLVNTPQLLLSFIYIAYNGILTSLLLSHEYLSLSTHRKTLRVSSPSGAQRSTFFLNLPYRYATPLMISMSLLHWLVSESLFLARINVLDYNYNLESEGLYNGIGWSPIALVFALVLGGLLIAALPVLGLKRFPLTMPLAASNSAAISAACHPKAGESGQEMVLCPLMYGVLPSSTNDGIKRVGFSAEEVEPLVKGEVYAFRDGRRGSDVLRKEQSDDMYDEEYIDR